MLIFINFFVATHIIRRMLCYVFPTLIIFSHEKALEGITICGEIRGQDRFTPIIQGLSMEDPNMKVKLKLYSYVIFIFGLLLHLKLHHNIKGWMGSSEKISKNCLQLE